MNQGDAPSAPDTSAQPFLAFAGERLIAAGELTHVAAAARAALDADQDLTVLVFAAETGQVIDLDLRGTPAEVAARYVLNAAPARRGRPKLGVVAREVTLLPRHWDWLGRQPGGASVTLRKLVDAARRADEGAARQRTEGAYRFMSVMAGDRPGFEEASRALFAGDRLRLAEQTAAWPDDVRAAIWTVLGEPPPAA